MSKQLHTTSPGQTSQVTTTKCRHCLQQHDLVYSLGLGGLHQMFYRCKKTTVFVERVDGLQIPTIKSKKLLKFEKEQQQGSLFS